MLKVVVSDFHVSAGSPPGRLNPYEDFHYDETFAEFLGHYSSG